jgi:predicted secreted protein
MSSAIRAINTLLGVANKSFTISNVTTGANTTVTATGHTYSNSQTVVISGVEGMSGVNGTHVVTGVSGANFNLTGNPGSGTFADADGNARAEQFTTVAEITSLNPSLSSDELDVSNHDAANAWREFIQGLKSGEISFEANYLPGNATHDTTTTTGLLGLYDAGTVTGWSLLFPDSGATRWTFRGFVREFSVSGPVDDKLGFSCTLRITGSIDLN